MDTDHLADGLLAATLPAAAWTHAAHVGAAHALVRRLGAEGAAAAFRTAVPRLNEAHGGVNDDSHGYHETVTVFFIGAVADCVARGLDAEATLAELGTAAPTAYWSAAVLWSVAARRAFVPPDLAEPAFPLPVGDLVGG